MGTFSNLLNIVKVLVVPKDRSGKENPEDFFKLPITTAGGKQSLMSQYRGRPLIIVNTASQCGFTPQYKALQEIYEKHKGAGLEILGFPCNDFGAQEPGTESEITSFCEVNFGVSFPLFKKAPVLGKDKQPVFKYLTELANPDHRGDVAWNFEKFLIDKDGRLIERFRSTTKPDSEKFMQAVQRIMK
jgi:glutathione peroxidase